MKGSHLTVLNTTCSPRVPRFVSVLVIPDVSVPWPSTKDAELHLQNDQPPTTGCSMSLTTEMNDSCDSMASFNHLDSGFDMSECSDIEHCARSDRVWTPRTHRTPRARSTPKDDGGWRTWTPRDVFNGRRKVMLRVLILNIKDN